MLLTPGGIPKSDGRRPRAASGSPNPTAAGEVRPTCDTWPAVQLPLPSTLPLLYSCRAHVVYCGYICWIRVIKSYGRSGDMGVVDRSDAVSGVPRSGGHYSPTGVSVYGDGMGFGLGFGLPRKRAPSR